MEDKHCRNQKEVLPLLAAYYDGNRAVDLQP
jgi:hypothetical protein